MTSITKIKQPKICTRCVLDSLTPDISFDKNGVCNYCELHDRLCCAFPNDSRGTEILKKTFQKIRQSGKGREYDCIIGTSGGTDSTYLFHLAKEYGLRPLAVHLDNGWDSAIAVKNIKNTLQALDVDLITKVINWQEIKDILLSYMKASFGWADAPTDVAIVSTLYRVANSKGIKYVLVGNNFRTEGRQPTEWTYTDGRMLKFIQSRFGTRKLKTFPNMTMFDFFYFVFLKKIKIVRPFYYIDYDKQKAKNLISSKYGWVDYGGHHHESIFTRFIIGCWLPQKFGIDKRKVTFSAQIRSGQRKRDQALSELKNPPYDLKLMKEDREYILKKFNITEAEFEEIWNRPNKSMYDFQSYYPIYKRFSIFVKYIMSFLPEKPMFTFGLNQNE